MAAWEDGLKVSTAEKRIVGQIVAGSSGRQRKIEVGGPEGPRGRPSSGPT